MTYTEQIHLESLPVGDLARIAQDGDREAFGELVKRFEGAVYGTAMRRLRNHAEAQELTQEVFVKAMRKLDQLHEPEAFPGWLRAIAARMAINRAVRRGPAIATDPETLEATYAKSETPLDRALSSERRDQVHAGLDRLGDLDRRTLEAFYLEGQSLNEMSDQFHSPVGTIKRRLHVARKRLAKELETLAV